MSIIMYTKMKHEDFRGESYCRAILNEEDLSVLEQSDISGMVLNNCAFEVEREDWDIAHLESRGVLVYKPIYTVGERLDSPSDFTLEGVLWKNCKVRDVEVGKPSDEVRFKVSSRFLQTDFENCTFGEKTITSHLISINYTPLADDCVFEKSTFRSRDVLGTIRNCYMIDCVFDRVSFDLRQSLSVGSVLDTYLVYAMFTKDAEYLNKHREELGKLSTFENCTFQGLRPTRRRYVYDSTASASNRVLRFPQEGIETCTFDVYFPVQDTSATRRDGHINYAVANEELGYVFAGRGYGDPLYPDIFENSDKCRTLLEVIEMNNICDQYVGIELSALKRAKAVIFRLWMDVKGLHLVGIDPSTDTTQFGMELAGCLVGCTFENVGLHFHPQLEDLEVHNYHLDTLDSTYTGCEIYSPRSSLKVGEKSVFQECELRGEFALCIGTHMNSKGEYSKDNPRLSRCDLRSARVRLVGAYSGFHTDQRIAEARSALVYMFDDCLIGEYTRISISDVELSLEDLLGKEFRGCFTLEEIR